MKKNRGLATIQILILLIATIAFSYALGDGIKNVSADGNPTPTKCEDCSLCSQAKCDQIKKDTNKNCVFIDRGTSGVNCIEINRDTPCTICGNFPGEVGCDRQQCDLIKTHSGKNCVFDSGTLGFNPTCKEVGAEVNKEASTTTPTKCEDCTNLSCCVSLAHCAYRIDKCVEKTATQTTTTSTPTETPDSSSSPSTEANIQTLLPAATPALDLAKKIGLTGSEAVASATGTGVRAALATPAGIATMPTAVGATGTGFRTAALATNSPYAGGVGAGTTAGAGGVGAGIITPPAAITTWGYAKLIGMNALQAAGIYAAVKILLPIFLKDEKGVNSAAAAVAIGYFAASTAKNIGLSEAIGNAIGISTGLATFGIGLIIAAAIFFWSYKKTDEQKVAFSCEPWQAPLGGTNCEKCNKKGDIPCTEYQCRALGQSCEIENAGTTEELCIWKNRKDISPPIMTAWKDALLSKEYTYTPDSRVSPPDKGVYIKYNGGCIPYWTPFTFGVNLSEPARCKIDVTRKRTFDEMVLPFGGSTLLKYNHTHALSLPSKESLEAENFSLKNGGNYEIYVMCQDANGNPLGNSSSASFVFKYCVDMAPDTTPPKILAIDPPSGEPINFNQSNLSVKLYMNEPSDCKWTYDRDKDYSQMENNMSCVKNATQMNAQMTYLCNTTLTGIRSRQENDFYFRCKDKPLAQEKDRYANAMGEKFIVYGTQPLVIDSVSPNGTIKDSVDLVKVSLNVQTSGGYKDGESICYYSESCYKKDGSKIKYTDLIGADESYSYTHTEDIRVSKGTYQCSVRCIDRGGNADIKEVNYTVETDAVLPKIVRIFKEDTFLKVITDEEGECVYDTLSCKYEFKDGLSMNNYKTEHYTDWKDQTYYIKCKDLYLNQPSVDQCTLVVSPSQIFNVG